MSETSPPTPRRRRHSPAVYRRRRLVLLLAIVAVAAVVWLLIAQPWSGTAAETPATPSPTVTATGATPADTASATPEATTEATEESAAEAAPDATAAAEPCVAADITVEALTDQTSYASGENPELSIRLTNTGDTDCTLNVGTAAQSFEVSSGSDVWWRSTDCQTEPSDMTVLIEAGQEVTSAEPIVWDRTRSSVDTCDGDRPVATGGGATYHLSVSIGGIGSVATAPFQLY